ncbi:DUF551 domain-containing protein [Serratia marcescens]|uniref:DUF551 domain-containing protein n=1 Tax=Serratia marcescens TaxID=615 RepID=UPI003FA721E6
MSEWIKCSDRMPDYRAPVLITDGELVAMSCRSRLDSIGRDPWQTTYQSGDATKCLSTVTHWMPLPEPPTD